MATLDKRSGVKLSKINMQVSNIIMMLRPKPHQLEKLHHLPHK